MNGHMILAELKTFGQANPTDYAGQLAIAERGQEIAPDLRSKHSTLPVFTVLVNNLRAKIAEVEAQAAEMIDADFAEINAPISGPPATGTTTDIAPEVIDNLKTVFGAATVEVVPATPSTPVNAPVSGAARPTVSDVNLDTCEAGSAILAAGNACNGTITLTHTVKDGTVATGTVKGDGVYDLMKSAINQNWTFNRWSGLSIAKSRGMVADRERIAYAALMLRRAGWDVVVQIDDSPVGGVAPKMIGKRTAYMSERIRTCKFAAGRQVYVDSAALLAALPVSAPPAAAPAAVEVQAVAKTPPAKPASVAPVSAPPAPAPAPAPEKARDFSGMTREALLELVTSGDLSAFNAYRERLLAPQPELRKPNVPVITPPVAVTPVDVAPVVAAPILTAVPAKTETFVAGSYAPADRMSESLLRAVASTLRSEINRQVTNKFGSKGARPEIKVNREWTQDRTRVLVCRVTPRHGGEINQAQITAALDATFGKFGFRALVLAAA